MTLFQLLAALLTLAALFGWFNHRYLRLPPTIAMMLLGLATSLAVLAVGQFHPPVAAAAEKALTSIDFNETLLHGMLGFLLFAGALHIDLGDLRRHMLVIGTLATVGVLISTAVVGLLTWGLLALLGVPNVTLAWCLLFGALISPTDPIAVLAILKSVHAPKDLEVQIAGESLFNDGVGVVVFLAILPFVAVPGLTHATAADAGAGRVALLFAQEALGGAAFGLAIGLIAFYMLRAVDQYQVEILISLALVTGGYAAAELIHVSAPIAMVVAGLLIGNQGRALAMSDRTREHLDTFWELIDEVLNAVLFVLIGLEVLILALRREYLLAGLAAIPIVLFARWFSVLLPVLALRRGATIPPHGVKFMTWGGLRGGISVALALSLRGPLGVRTDPVVDLFTVMTYVVVVFSIVTQGLTMGPLLRVAFRRPEPAAAATA